MPEENKIIVCNIDEEGRFGGPERRIVLVAEGLMKFHIETLILIPRLDSARFEEKILAKKLWYKKLGFSRLTLERGKLIRYVVTFPFDLLATIFLLRKIKVDLVHVNGSYQFRSAIAAYLARRKLVWHVNDAKMHWSVKLVFTLFAPRISNAFIFSSKVAENYYFPEGFDREKIKSATIPPPVEVERFAFKRHEADGGDADHTEPVRIVTVTGINPDKGVEYFIEAASMVHKSCPNVSFEIAAALHDSHLEYFLALKKLIAELEIPEEIIKFQGFVDDVPGFLSGADIFLYSSNTEAGPAAVWEAMAAGLPVVTTNVGAIPEYLVHGVDALVSPVKDAKQLAYLTLQLVNNPELRAAMGRTARKKVENYLSVDVAARKHADLYREILINE